MEGESNLKVLLATMQPELNGSEYIFCSLSPEAYAAMPFSPLFTFQEKEGISLITTREQALRNGLPFDTTWAWIELRVHSSLSAVGFIAVISGRLAQHGISLNLVSAYYHDHLFVPWESRWRAMQLLEELSASN
ncbi:MAG: hypothetical protein A2Z16_07355 [Chloroflexi bacterium RBG_16_54_18]|nr:MAG: hypothetical protein A2Z16_07355 [Chloroflexi bacterium RBG_16_54_18]